MDNAMKPHGKDHHLKIQSKQQIHKDDLVEVWGDTVSLSALIKSILIGASLSLCFFYYSQWVLDQVVENKNLAHAYSMLFGLLGCLLAGFICSILFKPKRKILESDHQSMQWFDDLIEQWEKEGKSIGTVQDLPEKIVQELKDLNLYDAFVAYKHQQSQSGNE